MKVRAAGAQEVVPPLHKLAENLDIDVIVGKGRTHGTTINDKVRVRIRRNDRYQNGGYVL